MAEAVARLVGSTPPLPNHLAAEVLARERVVLLPTLETEKVKKRSRDVSDRLGPFEARSVAGALQFPGHDCDTGLPPPVHQ